MESMDDSQIESEIMIKPLQELISYRQISEQLHRYCFYFDSNNPEGLRGLFTDDAMVDYGPEVQTLVGVTDIINSISSGLTNTFEATSHHISNIVIDFPSFSKANVQSYLYAWHKYRNKPEVGHLWGQYSHAFRLEAGAWKISKLTLRAVATQDFHRSTMHRVERNS
jgi:hypothetical protein